MANEFKSLADYDKWIEQQNIVDADDYARLDPVQLKLHADSLADDLEKVKAWIDEGQAAYDAKYKPALQTVMTYLTRNHTDPTPPFGQIVSELARLIGG